MMKTPTKAELVKQVEKLEAKIDQQDRDREELRLRFVQAREKLENAHIQDENHADMYQTVHPDNAHWMSASDAYITIQTTGYDSDFNRMPKHRVCTIPVPDLTGGMRWNTELPEAYRCKESGNKYTYKVSPHWELVKENEYGQHWHHPHIETEMQVLVEQDLTIEDRDQFRRRQKREYLESMNRLILLAGQIQEFYNSVGQFPDEEVEVQVQFALQGYMCWDLPRE